MSVMDFQGSLVGRRIQDWPTIDRACRGKTKEEAIEFGKTIGYKSWSALRGAQGAYESYQLLVCIYGEEKAQKMVKEMGLKRLAAAREAGPLNPARIHEIHKSATAKYFTFYLVRFDGNGNTDGKPFMKLGLSERFYGDNANRMHHHKTKYKSEVSVLGTINFATKDEMEALERHLKVVCKDVLVKGLGIPQATETFECDSLGVVLDAIKDYFI